MARARSTNGVCERATIYSQVAHFGLELLGAGKTDVAFSTAGMFSSSWCRSLAAKR